MSDDDGADEKSPVEQAVEVLVYAPIGLLFEGASLLPQLVEKGRNQVTMARMVGRFAVEQGRGEATKAASKLGDQAAGLLDFLGDTLTPAPTPDAPPAPPVRPRRAGTGSGRAVAAAKTSAKAPAADLASDGAGGAPTTRAPASGGAAPSTTTRTGSAGSDGAAALAIPDYDGLSASHVVNRLAGLSARELEDVRQYEAAHRGRKTILSKVAQLQSA